MLRAGAARSASFAILTDLLAAWDSNKTDLRRLSQLEQSLSNALQEEAEQHGEPPLPIDVRGMVRTLCAHARCASARRADAERDRWEETRRVARRMATQDGGRVHEACELLLRER